MLMCCLSCAKADWCEQADRVEDYCINHEERPMTNADRIRAMTDEELADWLYMWAGGAPSCDRELQEKPDTKSCRDCWLDWLKSPAEEEEG